MENKIDELRKHERDYPTLIHSSLCALIHSSLCGWAADEIERLTAERALALANADGVYAKLMPKIERLRTVLTKIASRFEDYTYKGTLENSTREEALTALGGNEQYPPHSENSSEK